MPEQLLHCINIVASNSSKMKSSGPYVVHDGWLVISVVYHKTKLNAISSSIYQIVEAFRCEQSVLE
jgi:hypothetical protein